MKKFRERIDSVWGRGFTIELDWEERIKTRHGEVHAISVFEKYVSIHTVDNKGAMQFGNYLAMLDVRKDVAPIEDVLEMIGICRRGATKENAN